MIRPASVLTGEDGVVRLTPAYDLLCPRLVIRNDPRALSVVGKKERRDRADWLALAKSSALPEKAATRVLAERAAAAGPASAVVARSFLPAEQIKVFSQLWSERTASLA